MQENKPISKPPRDTALYRMQRSRRGLFDALALLIYLSIVYVWSLGLPPLGKDFRLLAEPREGLPQALSWFWSAEVSAFGASALAYHALNLFLLYACMLCLYRLTRSVMPERPIWLATLAAALFMANPVHSDGVLHLSSSMDLIPALAALAALAAYATHQRNPSSTLMVGSAIGLGAGTLLFPSNIGLPAVAVLYDLIARGPKSKGFAIRVVAFAVLAAAALYLHREHVGGPGMNIVGMFAPLYFVFYPLGFLPETAYAFHTSPWTGWLAAATTAAVLILIWRKSRHPAFLFGLGGAACARLFQGEAFVDPVHLVGGGALLFPSALLTITAVSVFARMMDHPKWSRAVIGGTTLLAVVFFGLQIASISAWRHAGSQVEAFRAKAMAWRSTEDEGVLGILPDYTYYRGAPMMLSESIRFDTPFGEAVPHRSLLKLHYALPRDLDIQWERLGVDKIEVQIVRVDPGPRATLLWPYTLGTDGGVEEDGGVTIRAESITEDTLTVVIQAGEGNLPKAIAP